MIIILEILVGVVNFCYLREQKVIKSISAAKECLTKRKRLIYDFPTLLLQTKLNYNTLNLKI